MSTFAGAAVSVPYFAPAQQPAIPVIGFLGSGSALRWKGRLRAFHQGLADAGFVDSRNVRIEYRWAEARTNRLPALAAELRRPCSNRYPMGSTLAP